MSDENPPTVNANPLITENLPIIKEEKEEQAATKPFIQMKSIRIDRRISRLNTSMKKIIKKIESQFPPNVGSLYDGKNIKVKKVRLIGLQDKYRIEDKKDKKDYNVFSNEDHIIKDLMTQFREKNEKDKIPKLIRKKMAFNRLYNITESSMEQLKNVKKNKKRYTLGEYQENILKAVDVNSVEQSEIMKLITNFNEIKRESDNVRALPPINIDIIKDHVYKKKKIEPKKKNMKEIMKKREPLDEFEKEERLIKSLRSFKSVPKKKRNKNFDVLPQYIRDIFAKNGY